MIGTPQQQRDPLEIVLGLVAIVLGTIYQGFVLSILWRWFFVPALGAPALSVAHAIGITLIIGMVVPSQSNDKPFWQRLVASVLHCTILLGIGWIVMTASR